MPHGAQATAREHLIQRTATQAGKSWTDRRPCGKQAALKTSRPPPTAQSGQPSEAFRSSWDSLETLLSTHPPRCIDVAKSLDPRRFLRRDFPDALPLRLEHLTFPAYEPPLQRWWLHWHDYYEIIVPLSGSGLFQIGDANAPFVPGQVLLVDTLKLHGGAEVPVSHRSLVILFPSSLVAPAGGLVADRAFLSSLATRRDGSAPVLPPGDPAAAAVMQSILELAKSYYQPAAAPADRFIACKLALLQLLRHLRVRFGTGETDDPFQKRELRLTRLREVLRHLEEHFTGPVSQPSVARLAGMSPSRFRAYFKETTGSMLAAYIVGLRVAKAVELLRTTSRSLAEIAAALGFADQSHFFRAFRSAMGCGPLEFRRRQP